MIKRNVETEYRQFQSKVAGLEQSLWEWSRKRPEARFIHSSMGHASAAFSLARATGEQRPQLALYYRSHAWLLAFGVNPVEVADAVAGRTSGATSMHLLLRPFVVDCNSIVGAQVPIAAGTAFVAKTEGRFVVCSMGDGATMTGVFFESLNIAARHELPLLLAIEDDDQVLGTPGSRLSSAGIEEKLALFGIPFQSVSGRKIGEVLAGAEWCVQEVQRGPVALVVRERRPGAHAMSSQAHPPIDDIDLSEIDPIVFEATRNACIERLRMGACP